MTGHPGSQRLPRITRRTIGLTALAGLLAGHAEGQAARWPTRPIRLIVPFAPGGPSDLVARYLGRGMTEEFGQPVVIDNISGATGLIGAAAAARAEPDGYTFVYTNVSLVVVSGFLMRTRPLDPLTDLAPVALLGAPRQVVLIHPSLRARNVQEFIAVAKRRRGELNFGSFGVGSSTHILGEMIQQFADADMTHVPYRGVAPALQELIAGRVHMMVIDFGVAQSAMDSGAVIPIAYIGNRRSPQLPDVPTLDEAGIPVEVSRWNGLQAPARTPRSVIDRVAATVVRLISTEEGTEFLARSGLEATPAGPDAFAAQLARDVPIWERAIRGARIEMQ